MSLLTSQLSAAPRWTPPIPPVAKQRMPAACAARIVALDGGGGQAALGEERTDVPRRRLCRMALRVGQAVEQRLRGADDDEAVLDRHGRRHRARRAHRLLGRACGVEVVGRRQALGDEARLERHHRRPIGERKRHLLGDRQPRGRRLQAVHETGAASRAAGAGPSAGTWAWAPVTRVTAAACDIAAASATSHARRDGGQGRSASWARRDAANASPAPVLSTGGAPAPPRTMSGAPPSITAAAARAVVTTTLHPSAVAGGHGEGLRLVSARSARARPPRRD